MINIRVDGLDRAVNQIGNAGKQARFAASVALTSTAWQVNKRLKSDMQSQFDNPSPWIIRGTALEKATKAKLQSTVSIREPQSRYVKEHFQSGFRGQKPYERVLSSMGILPSGWRAVPGAGLKLDSRGIPNRTQLREMIGSVSTRMQTYKGKGKRMQTIGYFAVRVGTQSHLRPGIYLRSARAIRPMLIFVQSAGYDQILDLEKIGRETVRAYFQREFDTAFANAMRTAR